jgi:kinesin family member C2/C3
VEKSKLDEKRKHGEQDMVRLIREKESAENRITSLQQEIQVMSRMHEQYREQMETEARQMEEHLATKVKEAEFQLMQSKKKAEEIESASQLNSLLWSRKANIFQSFMDNQKLSIKVHLSVYFVISSSCKFSYVTYLIYYSTMLGHKDIIPVH